MRLNNKFFRILFAFIKAPIWLAMFLTIILLVFSLIDNDFNAFYFNAFLIITLTFIISYANLVIFGLPAYLIFKKYNFLSSNIALYYAFIIGFIESVVVTWDGPNLAAGIVLSITMGICGMAVSYPLLKNIRKLNDFNKS
jgi:hypothetical protein